MLDIESDSSHTIVFLQTCSILLYRYVQYHFIHRVRSPSSFHMMIIGISRSIKSSDSIAINITNKPQFVCSLVSYGFKSVNLSCVVQRFCISHPHQSQSAASVLRPELALPNISAQFINRPALSPLPFKPHQTFAKSSKRKLEEEKSSNSTQV